MAKENLSIESTCVHAGTYFDPATGGVNTPIFTSSSFRYPSPDGVGRYPRYQNVKGVNAAAVKLAVLEHAEDGIIVSSGMSAVTVSLLPFLSSGHHVILPGDIYGGTHHMVMAEFPKLGIVYEFLSEFTAQTVADSIRPETRIVYIETPSNPRLGIVDLAAIAQVCRERGVLTVVDNTFASPINQNPILLGCDIVLHSGTKYLNGHSDLCCGAVVSSAVLMESIRETAVNLGTSLNAMDAYILERGMKTLALRMERQNENAMVLAGFLQNHDAVTHVYYPGLESHPGHDIACRQMRGFGGMLSFELDGDALEVERFLECLRLVTPALSLGGVETLVCVPAQTSHVKMSAEDRAQAGITDTLVRVSVGIENINDIIDDFSDALN
ncbi:trans-sulfuration enzyme family protein [Desulfovibrio inopinatus]|uniref:trans-sulfuration enzyme family protein n=1 Tax=Desulfovibrio inopinatus TaxID=102109 RepID=UPI000418A167|nr:PLP-dependent aspartate aminotransferase family protein [Desulfovibrio inopinatus]